MESINYITAYPISAWEASTADRPDIEFVNFQCHRRLVCGVNGNVTANGKTFRVQWLHDGRCYCKGKRARQYDVKF